MEKLKIIFPILAFVIVFANLPAFALDVSLDRTSYVYGDLITVSGRVSAEEGKFLGLQILSPAKSDIVAIDQFLPDKDGTFLKTYKAQGPKWQGDGSYTIKLVYGEQSFEKTFQFKTKVSEDSAKLSKPSEPDNRTEKPKPSETSPSKIKTDEPKTRIAGFPNPYKSPNYYLERYYNEPEYKIWFDKAFPEYTIEEVVSYTGTHIEGFPDNENPPSYYLGRYNNEKKYQEWFDSQFPSDSIYDVLEYPESLFHKVPEWIKNNARWWSEGLIGDFDFLKGVEFMINEKIILMAELPEKAETKTQEVPQWVKNTAKWWSEDLIEENEFVQSLQFLVENGIITI